MERKSAKELDNILKGIKPQDFKKFYIENKDSMISEKDEFCTYTRKLIKQKGFTQQKIFIEANIPERYGYKLLSGEKYTRKRDVILRICYCAHFTLEETQNALDKYLLPKLYSKIPRDAFLMISFNTRPGNINDINKLLVNNRFEALKCAGINRE